MRTVLLASLKHNRRRYVASALAVVIGVAFIVATNGLAGALRDGMTKDVALRYTGAETVLELHGDADAEAAFRKGAAERGVVWTPQYDAWASVTAEGKDKQAEPSDVSIGSVAAEKSMQWQDVVDGRMPERDGEILVSEGAGVANGWSVGDRIAVPGSPTFDEEGDVVSTAPGKTLDVVGISRDTLMSMHDLYVRPGDGDALGYPLYSVFASGDTTWVEDVAADVYLTTAADKIDEEQKAITQGVDVIAMLVSLFAAIALMVAVLVITNTFAILFAQRARDFALLRCVGVTKKQLRRSVRIEAFVLGVVASVVGVFSGVAVAFGLAALARVWFADMGTATFSATWIVAAVVIGVLVTVVAAWLPTRAVTRISPLAALRPMGGMAAKSRAGAFRIAVGLLFAAAGTAVLAWTVVVSGADGSEDTQLVLLAMLAGGCVAFVGVLLLGPVVVPALVRVAGRLVSRRGAAGAVTRLATTNSVRNPRRTATTAASLMVGVTLTTAVLAGLSSVRTTLMSEMTESYPLDVAGVAAAGTDLSGDSGSAVLAAARDQEHLTDVVLVDGAAVSLGGNEVTALAVSQEEAPLRDRSDRYQEADVLVSGDVYRAVAENFEGDVVQASLVGPRGEVQVVVEWNDAYGAGTLAVRPEVLAKVADVVPTALWARAADGADPTDVTNDVTRAAAAAGVLLDVSGDYSNRAYFDDQFTVIATAVVGLLSVAVVIALIGIGNTLGLSVLERTQENSLLRAMGYTKSQMRRTLAWEGVLLAGVATLMGLAIGLAFGWVGLHVLVGSLPVETSFDVPVWQLVVMVAVAVGSGVLASVVPSRKAARISPAEGLAIQ